MLTINGSLPAGITASSYDASTGVITLSGAASFADYQTALRQVVYSSPNPTPFTGDRVIDVIVNDGVLDSNVATTYMHVAGAPPNIAPVLNLDADSSTISGTDYLTSFTGSAVAIVDTDVSILDSDDTTLVSATVTLTNPDGLDELTVITPPALPATITVTPYDPVTGVLMLTGTASLAEYQAVLQQIRFSTGPTPSAETRIIDVVVNDGTAASNIAHAIVEVVEVNASAPTLDLDGDNSTLPGTSYRTTFTENDPPVAIADGDTLVGDPDIGSTDIASATITLKNAEAGDTLAVSGALPGGITASAYDPATGLLTLSGVTSFANYEAALEAIRFSSAGDTPVEGTRIIEVVVNDGVNESQPAISLVRVVAVDDAPTFSVVTNATFQENSAAVLLSPAVTLTDTDDTVLNGALVRITDGSFPGDGDTLTVNGATSGTASGIAYLWNPTLHALVFTGASSVANYQALLQQVQFQSSSDNPTDFNASPQRTLTWSVTDGAAVKTATMTLDIIAVNDAPQVSVAATVGYTENGAALAISPAATTSDVDDVNLVAGVVRIASGAFDGDILSVNGLQSGTFSGIDFSYDAALHSLLFTRPTSVADYQAFLQAVQFQSTSDNPTNFGLNPTRTLSWPVFDGDAISPFQSTEITINAIDDPAVAQDDSVTTNENTAITTGNVLANNGAGVDSDPDSAAILVTAVSGGALGTQLTLPSGALLTLNANGTFSYDPNHLFDYLPTPGSGASNLTIIDTFTYTITGGDTATVTVTVGGVDTNDVLHDSAGIDSLAGGIGDDVYYVSNTGDVVTEAASAGFDTVAASVNYTLPVSNTVEVLNMLGSGLTGTGTDGPETFISSSGPNTLIGLGGNDTYYVSSSADVVIEAANGGIDTVEATVDYTLPTSNNVEALYMLGSGLTGTGSNGAETLLSSGGPNTLVGLGGNDLYYVNNAADVVIEAANGGIDTVAASVDYTMPANAEGLYMFGSGLTGTGTGGANSLLSSGGPNTLVGLGGDDLYYLANPADVVVEAANGGFDSVLTSTSYTLPVNVEALYTVGSGLTGTGNSGANTLVTVGANTLTGGDGNDTFVFFAGSANGASVTDFNRDQVTEWDFLVFSGFGTETQGATFSQIGTTDQWQLHSGLDAHNETITFSNHAAPNTGDFFFV